MRRASFVLERNSPRKLCGLSSSSSTPSKTHHDLHSPVGMLLSNMTSNLECESNTKDSILSPLLRSKHNKYGNAIDISPRAYQRQRTTQQRKQQSSDHCSITQINAQASSNYSKLKKSMELKLKHTLFNCTNEVSASSCRKGGTAKSLRNQNDSNLLVSELDSVFISSSSSSPSFSMNSSKELSRLNLDGRQSNEERRRIDELLKSISGLSEENEEKRYHFSKSVDSGMCRLKSSCGPVGFSEHVERHMKRMSGHSMTTMYSPRPERNVRIEDMSKSYHASSHLETIWEIDE
mmetsp:Transcript_128/g.218  ORF Transcript_128/g.218 Transcript_128/m.218 type:complete len:292 (-) Transcript_128:130-1005(-)